MSRKSCFDPVVNEKTRLLILGSLPGEKSLAQNQYYAHKQNSFWYWMSQVLATDLVPLKYEDRLATLLKHGVGLWDVVADAVREGSLDSSIKEHRGNDLSSFLLVNPSITSVAFNGKTAAKLGHKQLAGIRDQVITFELPSSSPAFTLAVADKVNGWLALQSTLATDKAL